MSLITVTRNTDAEKINDIIEDAICDMEAKLKHKYDGTSATLVIDAFEKAGVPVKTNGAVYTGNMYDVFIKTGFKDVTPLIIQSMPIGEYAKAHNIDISGRINTPYVLINATENLRRGDVLLDPQRCAYVYLGNGNVITAVCDELLNPVDTTTIDYTADIISYKDATWYIALRYAGL